MTMSPVTEVFGYTTYRIFREGARHHGINHLKVMGFWDLEAHQSGMTAESFITRVRHNPYIYQSGIVVFRMRERKPTSSQTVCSCHRGTIMPETSSTQKCFSKSDAFHVPVVTLKSAVQGTLTFDPQLSNLR